MNIIAFKKIDKVSYADEGEGFDGSNHLNDRIRQELRLEDLKRYGINYNV